jgi:hypothetical protein
MITYCSDGLRPIKHGEYGVDGLRAAAVAFAARLGRVDGFDQDEAECESDEGAEVLRGFLAS